MDLLYRVGGLSGTEIGEMMGHSTSQVTEHYQASLDMDKTWEINEGLFKDYWQNVARASPNWKID